MINIPTIRKMENNGGLTLKKGKIVDYKTGYQVATHGIEVHSPEAAIKAVREMEGNCGIWLENGIYYIDFSFRVNTKHKALEIGRAHNQISIFCWKTKDLAYCQQKRAENNQPPAFHRSGRCFTFSATCTIFILKLCVKLLLDFIPEVWYNKGTKKEEVHTLWLKFIVRIAARPHRLGE